MQTADKKVINGWAMYDWANSVYNLVITTTFFPVLYNAIVNGPKYKGKIEFFGRTFSAVPFKDYCMAVSFLLVVIMIPILSSMADTRGNKKRFMFFFCLLGSVCCSGLFFFDSSNVIFSIFLFCMATIGFYGSQVFYNSYLPEIAHPDDQDRISAKGYTFGYIGSVILQLIGFALVIFLSKEDKLLPLHLTFLLVGIWWFSFAQITFKRLPPSAPAIPNRGNILKDGLHELKKVIDQLRHLPLLKRYLISFFLYSAGVQSVMLVASDFGLTELRLEDTTLIVTVVIIQLVAIIGAVAMAKLSKRYGNLKTLMFTVLLWIGVCFAGYSLGKSATVLKPYTSQIEQLEETKLNIADSTEIKKVDEAIEVVKIKMKPKQESITYGFYMLAVAVGLVMGGIQALSRATYAKFMPETKDTASFFSFYDVTEKLSIVIGIFSFGFIHEWTGSMSNSILALIVFFVLGFIMLILTQQVKKKQDAVA
jgi:MFS transporter, UMF1 family